MALSTLRKIDDRFVNTVFGWFRRCQCHISNKIVIPKEIKHLCLDFYLLQQYFEHHDIQQTIVSYPKVINNNLHVTFTGNQVIDLDDTSITKYIWKFKLLSFATSKGYRKRRSQIGLISRKLARIRRRWKPVTYAFEFDNITRPSNKQFLELGIIFKENDIYTMVFDAEQLALGFGINDEKILWLKTWGEENRDKAYVQEKSLRMMCILPAGGSVELVQFYVEHTE